jgi:predicted unusual protein kinase regulating ubiquinone biosynthesis (AarF/ABC1/UbiB family)
VNALADLHNGNASLSEHVREEGVLSIDAGIIEREGYEFNKNEIMFYLFFERSHDFGAFRFSYRRYPLQSYYKAVIFLDLLPMG